MNERTGRLGRAAILRVAEARQGTAAETGRNEAGSGGAGGEFEGSGVLICDIGKCDVNTCAANDSDVVPHGRFHALICDVSHCNRPDAYAGVLFCDQGTCDSLYVCA